MASGISESSHISDYPIIHDYHDGYANHITHITFIITFIGCQLHFGLCSPRRKHRGSLGVNKVVASRLSRIGRARPPAPF